MQYEFDRKDNFVSEQALSLGEYSIKWIKYIKTIDLEACLKLANSLLRLEIIIWTDIYYFCFLQISKLKLFHYLGHLA